MTAVPGTSGIQLMGLVWPAVSAFAIAVFAPLPHLLDPLPELAAAGGEVTTTYATRPSWVLRAYVLVPFLCWVPDLLLVELLLRRERS